MSETNFFERVYKVVKQIPPGRVSSFGAIARKIGAAKSARMVGYALNRSAKIEDVPAHRVVNRNGLLTGKHHFGDSNAMKNLLEEEGIKVKENKVQNFKKIFWDPNLEI